MPAKPARGGMWEPQFHPGVFVGMLNSSSEAVVVSEEGLAVKTRSANVRRIPVSERWDADRILGMRAVPWSPDGSDNAFDIQVGMERPAEMVPRAPGDVLMENEVVRTCLRRADFEQWGLGEVLENWSGAQRCRRRIEGLLKGDPTGSARLPAADERINRALADAVERHAVKDLSSRVRIPKENRIGHRAGLNTTLHSLVRRIISARTQRHHKL